MKLNLGDTIGIISPSGPISDCDLFYKNIDFIKGCGYKVKVLPSALKKRNYLAGSDTERLEDLHNAFLDIDIKAILCSRGGYGAIRLIDKIDYNIIKNNPKIFIGSSDVTILLALMYKNAGLKGFFGPMLMNGFCDNFSDYTSKINSPRTIEPKAKYKVFIKGHAQGVLWGGNLSSIVSLFGSDNYMSDDDIILFLEDINEAPYKLDKMFCQIYRNKALLGKIKAIVLGEFTGLSAADTAVLDTLFEDYSKKFNVPFVWGFKITHAKNSLIIPFGAKAKLCDTKICLL